MHWQSLLADPLKSHYREISDEHNAEPDLDDPTLIRLGSAATIRASVKRKRATSPSCGK